MERSIDIQTIVAKIQRLPEAKQREVNDFVSFLLHTIVNENITEEKTNQSTKGKSYDTCIHEPELPSVSEMNIRYKKKTMRNIIVQLPDTLDLNENETKRFIAAKMYESGRLSLGQAADVAGVSKTIFSEILGDFNVSLINYPPSDIIRDAQQF